MVIQAQAESWIRQKEVPQRRRDVMLRPADGDENRTRKTWKEVERLVSGEKGVEPGTEGKRREEERRKLKVVSAKE